MKVVYLPNAHTIIVVPEEVAGPPPEEEIDPNAKHWFPTEREVEYARSAVHRLYGREGPVKPLDVSLIGDNLLVQPVDTSEGSKYRMYEQMTEEQRNVMKLREQGLTADQIAAKLHRRRRWVRYRLAEVKRLTGRKGEP